MPRALKARHRDACWCIRAFQCGRTSTARLAEPEAGNHWACTVLFSEKGVVTAEVNRSRFCWQWKSDGFLYPKNRLLSRTAALFNFFSSVAGSLFSRSPRLSRGQSQVHSNPHSNGRTTRSVVWAAILSSSRCIYSRYRRNNISRARPAVGARLSSVSCRTKTNPSAAPRYTPRPSTEASTAKQTLMTELRP
jgi:hypothetical protein